MAKKKLPKKKWAALYEDRNGKVTNLGTYRTQAEADRKLESHARKKRRLF